MFKITVYTAPGIRKIAGKLFQEVDMYFQFSLTIKSFSRISRDFFCVFWEIFFFFSNESKNVSIILYLYWHRLDFRMKCFLAKVDMVTIHCIHYRQYKTKRQSRQNWYSRIDCYLPIWIRSQQLKYMQIKHAEYLAHSETLSCDGQKSFWFCSKTKGLLLEQSSWSLIYSTIESNSWESNLP